MNARKLFFLFITLTLSFTCLAQVPAGVYYKIENLIRNDSIAKADSLINHYLTVNPNIGELYINKAHLIEKHYTDTAKKQSISLDSTYKYPNYIPYRYNPPMPTHIVYPYAIDNQIEENLLKASDLIESNLMAEFELVRFYSLQLKRDKIKPIFKKVRAKRNESYIGLQFSNQIANFFKQNQFNNGVSVYNALIEVYPDRQRLKEELALQYFYHHDINMALRISEELYSQGNTMYSTVDLLITLNQYLGNYDEATKLIYTSNNSTYLFSLALMELKTKPDKWKSSLHSYLQIGQDEVSIKIAKQMVADTFMFTPEYYNILLNHNPDEKTKLLLANAFTHPKAQLDYVKLLLPYDLTDEALDKLKEIEKPKKLSTELKGHYYLSLGWCYSKSEDNKDAVKAWKKAVDIGSKSTETYMAATLLSNYYKDVDDTKNADKYTTKAKALQPVLD